MLLLLLYLGGVVALYTWLLFIYLPAKGHGDRLATRLFGFVYLRFETAW